jgi:hypothetical protein
MTAVIDITPDDAELVDDERFPFTFCGVDFALSPWCGVGALLRFTAALSDRDTRTVAATVDYERATTDEARETASREFGRADQDMQVAVVRFLRDAVGQDHVDRLLTAADMHGVDDILAVCGRIQAVLGARPTRRSTDSPGGPSRNGRPSTDGGSGVTARTPAQAQRSAIRAASEAV